MALATAAAATTAAYVDAKFHVSKDIQTLLALFNGNRDYSKAAQNGKGNCWFTFLDTATKNPGKRCIWTREREYNYSQALDLAVKYAHFFHSLGVKSGDLVAFYLQNRPDFLFAWLGLWCLGSAPAAINYNLTGEALEHCLRVSGAKVVLLDDDPKCVERMEGSRPVIENELGMDIRALNAIPLNNFPGHILPRDGAGAYNMAGDFPCILLYTSGTTGMPKGCAFTMDRLYPRLSDRESSSQNPNECWYSCMPLYHGTAAISQMANLVVGVCVALGKRFSVRHFWPDVRDSRATTFVYVGEAVRYLLAAPPSPLDRQHSVKSIFGNGLRPDVWERFRERFGITQVMEFFNSSEGVFSLINDNRGPFTSGSVGHHGLLLRFLLRNTYIPVAVDPVSGDVLRDAQTGFAVREPYSKGGEILVRIPDKSAFQGYWQNQAATDKKFLRDVFAPGDLFYRSGDALRRTDDGRWYFLDRLGDTFRWKSENVSTAEVAQALGQFPGLLEANVYGVQIPHHEGRAGCAAVQIIDQTGGFDFRQLAQFARQKLPKYAVPVFVRLVQGASHVHNHKQNKVPLRDEGVDMHRVNDRIWWLRDEGYVPFTKEDWEAIERGDVAL